MVRSSERSASSRSERISSLLRPLFSVSAPPVVDPLVRVHVRPFVVLVELERESLVQLDAFRKRVRGEPQVQQCYYVTGEADFILICTARDMQDFEALTHRLFFEDSNVRRFRTSVSMERTKVGLSLPI